MSTAKLDVMLDRLTWINGFLEEYMTAQRKQAGGSQLHYTQEINNLLRARERTHCKINQLRQRLWLWGS